jgi:hypothetical protein
MRLRTEQLRGPRDYRNSTRQRFSSSSRVFGRKVPSRLLRRSWEIARSCSGIAKLRSLSPPSEAGFEVKRTDEIGAGGGNRQREAEVGAVQLIDGDDRERSRPRLLGATARIGTVQ